MRARQGRVTALIPRMSRGRHPSASDPDRYIDAPRRRVSWSVCELGPQTPLLAWLVYVEA